MTVVRIISSTVVLRNNQRHGISIIILARMLEIMPALVNAVMDFGWLLDVDPIGLTTLSELNATQ
jgi:hypothetical protein